jgi:hypothetical protein
VTLNGTYDSNNGGAANGNFKAAKTTTLAGNTTVTTGTGTADFTGAVNATTAGTETLTVNSGGVTTFGAAVGGTKALGSLTTDAAGSTALNAAGTTAAPSVKTTGAQTFNDTVTLGANVVLNSTASGNITFGKTINGAFALEVNTAGNEVFNDLVGNTTALTTLTTDASNLGGNVVFNKAGTAASPSVKTTGVQTYNDAVTLGADTLLKSGSTVTFNSTVDGAQNLVVDAPLMEIGSDIGLTTRLTTISAQSVRVLRASGVTVRTAGSQSYVGPFLNEFILLENSLSDGFRINNSQGRSSDLTKAFQGVFFVLQIVSPVSLQTIPGSVESEKGDAIFGDIVTRSGNVK